MRTRKVGAIVARAGRAPSVPPPPGATAPSRARRDSTVWLLDLDNTLHDASSEVFPRIHRAMVEFVAAELSLSHADADALRFRYWQRYGATLLGMVRHHDIDAHRFLRETHVFPDLERIVRRDRRLEQALRRLPGRRIVLTNAPLDYAVRVVRALGIARCVEAIVSIESMRFAGRFQPKPSRAMLRRLAARLGVPAPRCVLVEDTPANLAAARAVGMRTVLVTGTTRRSRHGVNRLRVGSSRRIGLQVQSVAHLPRKVRRGEA
ncbi:MAG: pyrimidine 5'-nucleotidase [Burkholderiaceae bacterium]|nr:pyrimidine 5'-nucleotidase [Burkholderiaceae bacterium]